VTRQWYYTPDGRTMLGPFSAEEMQRLARSGQLKRSHRLRRDGVSKWAEAGTFREFSQPPPAGPDARVEHSPPAPAPVAGRLTPPAPLSRAAVLRYGTKVREVVARPFRVAWSVARSV
jgi:hypothetical protein